MKKLLIGTLIALNLAACSHVKSVFPDKEKDYQLITEIPELVVPADLSNNTIESTQRTESVESISRQFATDVANSQEESRDNTQSIAVDLVEFTGGATRIRIADSLMRSWRTVGKAITRHSIEVIERDELSRVYFVRYDPEFESVEDGSLWDEALFIFGSDPAKDKEFRIRLVDNARLTEVLVLDSDDVPLSDGNGLKLLTLLYTTIKQDITRAE